LVGDGGDAFRCRIAAAEHVAHEWKHIHDHQLADGVWMARGEHHADRAPHGVPDHSRTIEIIFTDVAGDLFGDRSGHRAITVAADGRAGKAVQLHEVDAVIVIERVCRRVPDVA
jgi:hypothetical protein